MSAQTAYEIAINKMFDGLDMSTAHTWNQVQRSEYRDTFPTYYMNEKVSPPQYKELRGDMVKHFSWAIPNMKALKAIAALPGPILEVGAGNGYWAYELGLLGAKVTPTADFMPKSRKNHYKFDKVWQHVQRYTATEAVEHFTDHSTLMMVWPCYNKPWANDALLAFKGSHFAYVGEGWGGCTGDDAFHENIKKYFAFVDCIEIPQWQGIRDSCWIYKRK